MNKIIVDNYKTGERYKLACINDLNEAMAVLNELNSNAKPKIKYSLNTSMR